MVITKTRSQNPAIQSKQQI